MKKEDEITRVYLKILEEGRLANLALATTLLAGGISSPLEATPKEAVQKAELAPVSWLQLASDGDSRLMNMMAKTVKARMNRFGCSMQEATNAMARPTARPKFNPAFTREASELVKNLPEWSCKPENAPVLIISSGDKIPEGYEKSSEYKGYIFLRLKNLTEKEDFVARTIYSETSSVCTKEEVNLVCDVIYNRIGDRNFGKTENAYDVCNMKNAFSATADGRHNTPWNDYPTTNDKFVKNCQEKAKELMSGNYTPENKKIVYYHDKSISCPKSWTNKYWRPKKEKETAHFIFYSIAKNLK